MPRRQHNQNGQHDQHNQQQGGMTTSDWGVKTFGDMGQQSAVPGTNLLAIKGGDVTPTTDPTPNSGFLSGLFSSPQPTGGSLGALMTAEVATPVLLTVVSNQVAKRLGKTRKTRGGDLTTVAVPAMLVLANNQVHKLLGKSKATKGGRRGRKTQRK
jgi:hypothetical protein